jgi:class 3 adenylate cyclase
MDVVALLRGLGLEGYAPAFAASDIDGEVLPELTADDLIGLGVTSIGHRRKLLAAITALRSEAPQPVTEVAPVAAATSGEAERRQLTVMFCDLVGSTPLAARFDPEDLRDIIGAYHRCVADTVGRFDGFVAKYMGDGVLIYFGYPEAHEDDAERAVRAGLAVIDAIGRLKTPERLNVWLGLASGLVVVGDLIGAGAAQERGVVGETPNLAARLQTLAQPGMLVIAESTRRQIGALFEIEDLGPQPLAGFAEPQRAWRVLGESGEVSRFEALRSGETPLVGRDEELDLLLRRWQRAQAGEGRAVLISGEPGIGKSRLTAVLSEHLATEPHTRLRYFCSPHHQDSALYPFIVQLERAARFARADTPDERLDKLHDALLGQLEALARQRPALMGVRGRALDRSDLARIARPDGRSAAAASGIAGRHLPAGISAALGRASARRGDGTEPARRPRGRGAGTKPGRQCRAGARDRRRDCRLMFLCSSSLCGAGRAWRRERSNSRSSRRRARPRF